MKFTLIWLLAFALAGCNARANDPVSVGRDTYSVTGIALGGDLGRSKALGAANEKCASMGKAVQVTNISSEPINANKTDVIFQCVEPADQAPTKFTTEPNVKVQIQR